MLAPKRHEGVHAAAAAMRFGVATDAEVMVLVVAVHSDSTRRAAAAVGADSHLRWWRYGRGVRAQERADAAAAHRAEAGRGSAQSFQTA